MEGCGRGVLQVTIGAFVLHISLLRCSRTEVPPLRIPLRLKRRKLQFHMLIYLGVEFFSLKLRPERTL